MMSIQERSHADIQRVRNGCSAYIWTLRIGASGQECEMYIPQPFFPQLGDNQPILYSQIHWVYLYFKQLRNERHAVSSKGWKPR